MEKQRKHINSESPIIRLDMETSSENNCRDMKYRKRRNLIKTECFRKYYTKCMTSGIRVITFILS